MFRVLLPVAAILATALPAFAQLLPDEPATSTTVRSTNTLLVPIATPQTTGPSLFMTERDTGPSAIGAAYSFKPRPDTRVNAQLGLGRQDEIFLNNQTLVRGGRLAIGSVDVARRLSPVVSGFVGAQVMQEEWRDSWSYAVPLGITAELRKEYGLVHITPLASLGAALRHETIRNGNSATDAGLFAQVAARAGVGPVWLQASLVWGGMMAEAPEQLDEQYVGAQPTATAFAIRVGYSSK